MRESFSEEKSTKRLLSPLGAFPRKMNDITGDINDTKTKGNRSK